jgi:hypothetical protein
MVIGVHFRSLDVDLYVPALLEDVSALGTGWRRDLALSAGRHAPSPRGGVSDIRKGWFVQYVLVSTSNRRLRAIEPAIVTVRTPSVRGLARAAVVSETIRWRRPAFR